MTFRVQVLDGIEVGRVGREIAQLCSSRLDCLAHADDLRVFARLLRRRATPYERQRLPVTVRHLVGTPTSHYSGFLCARIE